MRYREAFTVFPRKMKSGRVVWYYQTYDKKGRRTTARSTGQRTKGAAKAYCNRLYKEDALIPNSCGNVLFEKYAENWWIVDKCEYIKYRNSRGRELSKNYINSSRRTLINQITPFFGKMRLDLITSNDIEQWLLKQSSTKGLSNATINISRVLLKVMLGDAVRRGLLTINPAEKVAPLKNDGKARDILTTKEVQDIFEYESIEKIWGNKIYYLANLLAACTGMRVSEVIALRKEVLFDDHILVSEQYHWKYGLIPTKLMTAGRFLYRRY